VGREEAKRLTDGEAVILAGLNSPRQTVISGDAAAVAAVMTRAKEAGVRAVRLPVSHAFHSPLVAAAAPALGRHLATEQLQPLSSAVYSTITGARLASGDDLGALLCRQVTSPVRFMEAVQAAAEHADLLIEVGPGEVISGLAAECAETPVVATDAGGPSLAGLLRAVAAAFVLGAPVRRAALFEGRHVKPFDLDYHPKFFANPCEQAPVMVDAERIEAGIALERDSASAGHPPAKAEGSLVEHAAAKAGGSVMLPPGATPLEVVRQLVAERTELPVSAVRDDNRLLSDLHLNSITVGQLVAESARRLGLPPPVAPTDYADATVAAVAQALDELRQLGVGATTADDKRAPPGVDAWIRAFTIELIERPVPHRQPPTLTTGWQVFAPPDYALKYAIAGAFARGGTGGGVILCLPPQPAERHVPLMLEAARAAMTAEAEAKTRAEMTAPPGAPSPIGPKFVLVQHSGGGAGLARTLHLERPKITTCVVDVPADHPRAAEWVLAEALAAMDYREAHYDAAGRRWVPRLRVASGQGPVASAELPLGPQDVLLVSGGGKGIAAECALALARECGVKLGLLGRSGPSGDAELAANLERMGKAGAVLKYVSADVTDAEQVRAAVRQIEATLGPVTGFLHGAGVNVPQLLTALDEAAFLEALQPKLQGARNVLAAVNPERLTRVLAFG
jgi:enediyne polyketide synthase